MNIYSIILLLPCCYYIKVSDTRVICVALLYIQPSPAYNTLRYYFVFVLFNIVLLLFIYLFHLRFFFLCLIDDE